MFTGAWSAYNYLPWDLPELTEPVDRVIFTLKWHGLTVATLYYMLEGVLGERAANAWNPMSKETQGNTILLGKILTNTVEQMLLFVTSTIILSTYLTSQQMRLIPIFVVTWTIGRLLFDFGYRIGPIHRSPGFGMTLIPSMFSLNLIAYFQYHEGSFILSIFSGLFAAERFLHVMNFLSKSFI